MKEEKKLEAKIIEPLSKCRLTIELVGRGSKRESHGRLKSYHRIERPPLPKTRQQVKSTFGGPSRTKTKPLHY